MDLETAQGIVNAHRQAEQEKRNASQRLFIGRYFKYHNSYSGGDRWWMYATVTAVNEWGHLIGWSFQHTSSNEIRIERDASISIGSVHSGDGSWSHPWVEINADEFWNAAAKISALVVAQLTREEVRRK